MFSQDNLDWYKEQKQRCFEGFSFRGDHFTGDQWWYYNFNPMLVAKLDKNGSPTDHFETMYPYWSQEDDYLFKQIEEARQEGLGVMLMTGRGYGKTYLVLSIGAKGFYLIKEFHGVISASGDDHADETWKKFANSIPAINRCHPTLALDLLADNPKELIAGEKIFENGKWNTIVRSFMEKIVYDKKPGKTKGRRLNYQEFEEIGDWGGAATLKECIAASEGSWKVGKTKKCREFYTGTGGTILSDQAKEVFHNPLAYGIYKVRTHDKRPTAIFIPSYKKFGGFWEKTGISDEIGAKAYLEDKRQEKLTDTDPTAYNKFIQEYPFTIDEMFMKRGGNRFDQKFLATQITMLEEFPEKQQGKWATLHWKRKDGEIIGVEIEYNSNGKVWILEEPKINPETGRPWSRLYVGGYDGIDVGQQDTASGIGSQGALSIKKRFARHVEGWNNAYVCHYFDRPKDIDEFFETSFQIMVLYGAITNIEDSKRGIVGYLKGKKGLAYLMKRPRLTLAGLPDVDKESMLIGTTPTTKNFEYGENFTVTYIKEYGPNLQCLPVLRYLRDFTMEERGKFDVPVSIFMAEIADDEFMDKPIEEPPKDFSLEKQIGYYTDQYGKKRWGEIPDYTKTAFNFQKDQPTPDHIKKGKGIFLNE